MKDEWLILIIGFVALVLFFGLTDFEVDHQPLLINFNDSFKIERAQQGKYVAKSEYGGYGFTF